MNYRISARTIAPIARYRGAIELGWYDFIARFRRAFFGPLWVTFQFALWIGMLSMVLYDALGESFRSYIVYLAHPETL
jgi:ABC-type polysaccharide/polyol phosphate export permease